MITVANSENTEVRREVIVHNYEIADSLITLGYNLKRIKTNKKYSDRRIPVYIFENADGLESILSGLIEKARIKREENNRNNEV